MEQKLDLSTIFKIPSLKKEYNVTNEKDKEDIENGRCPDYSLYWPEEKNKQYWPEGHNFYKGFDTEEPKEEQKEEKKNKRNIQNKGRVKNILQTMATNR